jgi:hypothetical protein
MLNGSSGVRVSKLCAMHTFWIGSTTVARPLERMVGRTLGVNGFDSTLVSPLDDEHFNMMDMNMLFRRTFRAE